jgi:riboflavin biosynthesis pyrimidine reductase
MVASLDGFIARRDGSVDWMETSEAVKSPVNAFAAALRYEVRR